MIRNRPQVISIILALQLKIFYPYKNYKKIYNLIKKKKKIKGAVLYAIRVIRHIFSSVCYHLI